MWLIVRGGVYIIEIQSEQFSLKSWVSVILLVTACPSSPSSLFLLFINKWSPSIVLPQAFALLLIPADRRFLLPLWQHIHCHSIISHSSASWPTVMLSDCRDQWLSNCSCALSYSFYTINEVIKFQYSRPVRKGEKDPDNEFSVCML